LLPHVQRQGFESCIFKIEQYVLKDAQLDDVSLHVHCGVVVVRELVVVVVCGH